MRLHGCDRLHAPPPSGVAAEINMLLSSTPLRNGDVRWLSGRLADVLISPVQPATGASGIVITVVATGGTLDDLDDLIVRAVDADGREHRVPLRGGHALVPVTGRPYRLSVGSSSVAEATPGRRRPVRRRSSAVAAGRTQASRRSGLRRWPAVAAGALLLGGSLLLRPPPPVEAVTLTPLSASCPSPAGGDDQRHVEIVAAWGEDERQRFKDVLTPFARKARIRMTLASRKDDPKAPDRNLGATLEARARNGCLPDLALLPQTGLLRHLVETDRVVPIEDVAGQLVDQHYTPAWRELGSVGEIDKVLYGVWFKASDKSLIWYNASAFETAGVREPRTWSELKEAAARLQAAGITPFSIAGHEDDAWTLTDWFENVYLRTAGREMYDELAKGHLAWTDQSVVDALEKLAEIFGQREWIAGEPEGARETGYEASVKKVFDKPTSPEAAMVFEGDFVANVVAETPSTVGREAKSFPFPTIGSSVTGAVVGGGGAAAAGDAAGGDVAVLMKGHQPAAEDLLRYLATPEAAEPWMKAGGFLSPNRSADLNHYRDDAAKAAATGLVEARSLSFDLSDQLPVAFGGTPGQGMWRILQDFLTDPSDPRGVAQRLQDGYDAATRRTP